MLRTIEMVAAARTPITSPNIVARLDGGSTLAAAQGILAPGQPQVRHRRFFAMARQAALLENRGGFGAERVAGRSHGS